MAQLIFIICTFLIIFNVYQESVAKLLTAENAFTATTTLAQALPAIKSLLRDGNTTDEQRILEAQSETMNKLDQLADNVQDVKRRILHKLMYTLPTTLSVKIDKLFDFIEHIQINYDRFRSFLKYRHYTISEMIAFAKVNTGFNIHDLPAVIKRLHTAFVDKDFHGESILSHLSINSHDYVTGCIRKQSAQQLIYELFKIVVDNDIKGYIIERFSYNVLYELDNDYKSKISKFNSKLKLHNQEHLAQLNNTYNRVKQYMINAPRSVWQCDEVELKRGVTYDKVENVFQGFLIYEADTPINTIAENGNVWDTLGTALSTTCAEIKNSRYRCNSQVCKNQPADRQCKGNLRDCTFLSEDMQACHSPPGSERRYDWMRKLNSQDYYGKYYDNCLNTQGFIGYSGFSVCLCNCESEKRDSDRYFSMLDVTSDIQDNKAVLGVRLVKVNCIFYIQILQGRVSKNGIVEGEVEWKKINEITRMDLLSDKVSTTHYDRYRISNKTFVLDAVTDFRKNDLVYTVTYDQNTIYLDDLEVLPGHLLTGLRFQQKNNALRLEIQLTPFDLESGEMHGFTSRWMYNKNNTDARVEAKSAVDDDPAKSSNPDVISTTNQYVRFKPSDLRKDAWQTTVPFIDIQPVVPKAVSPIPLTGVGLFYKHDNSHAGFLAFKVIHYNLAELM